MSVFSDAMDISAAQRGARKTQAKVDERLPLGVQIHPDSTGSITFDSDEPGLQVAGPAYDWDKILTHQGLDPELYEVDESYPIEVGSWQMGFTDNDGEASTQDLFRYKCKVRRRVAGNKLTEEHLQGLITEARAAVREPENKVTVLPSDPWLVVNVSDVQVGKGDFGGTPAMLERFTATLARVEKLCRDKQYKGVALVDLGDITEGCAGQYPDQAHTVDLNNTQQINTATDLMLDLIDAVYEWVPEVRVGFVPSNHGEIRQAGKNSATDIARDNVDLIIGSNIARLAEHRWDDVSVWLPPQTEGDPFVLTLDLDGVMVGWTHGHQIAYGANRMAIAEKWWMSHQWSDRQRAASSVPTVADADVLVFGHGHHLLMSQATGKLAVQCPAYENGSEWFTTKTGRRSSSGLLCFEVHAEYPTFVNNMRFL